MKNLSIGFDIGSVSINTVICTADGNILEELPYKRHFGNTINICADLLEQIEDKYKPQNIQRVVFTGTHGKAIASALNTYFEVETTAQTAGLKKLCPSAGTVISIGGHDSALLITDQDGDSDFTLSDFKLNEACAAGTGSFIDQQAERIFSDDSESKLISDPQKKIEHILAKFISEGAKAESPANVACRCTVFTKSDMIHLQNKGVEISKIIAGLHEGVARNFKSTLINNRTLKSPVFFIGGYASNKLAVSAFEKVLGTKISVPPHHRSLGAYGAVLNACMTNQGKNIFPDQIRSLKDSEKFKEIRTEPLSINHSIFTKCGKAKGLPTGDAVVDAYIGIDVGSTTTKLVIISNNADILYKIYLPTEGRPIDAIKKAMQNCMESIDTSRLNILGVGTTGSGREAAALFVGADDVVNEVTAHAEGTLYYDPQIDTIFELGGQDAKYTSIINGRIADFKMNKVCAAGTGSFLEETANKLGINIKNEYEELAMSSERPYKLAERCTVYMESDLMSFLQNGASVPDLLAGLSQAVVHNYLNRVVQGGKIGERISFQGGPSLNKSVVAAFELITGERIITLPHREVMGAIGAALHTKNKKEKLFYSSTKFKGWENAHSNFSHSEEICTRNPNCHNKCKLQIYKIGSEQAIYGGECGMYETGHSSAASAPNFGKIRCQIFNRYLPNLNKSNSRIKIGIPRSLSFHQLGILWTNFFAELGFAPVLSPQTNNELANDGIGLMNSETCFPVKISHGHAAWLKNRCDFMFLPLMIDMPEEDGETAYYCPYVESNTYMLKSALKLDLKKLIKPAVYFSKGEESIKHEIQHEFLRVGLKVSYEKLDTAWKTAVKKQKEFNREIKRVGDAVLKKLGQSKAIIVLGRPYTLYDTRTNLNLFSTLSKLGIYAIPQEFLNLSSTSLNHNYPNMYWGFGKKILRTSQLIQQRKNLFGLYLTSFSCGPDSFILHFFDKEMSDAGKPFLELELDEHSAGAGVETRLLAFIDTINNYQDEVKTVNISENKLSNTDNSLKNRTLYLPNMAAGAQCLAGAFRNIGIKTEILPTYTPEGLDFAKQNTSGKECYPCIVTTGDMLSFIDKQLADDIDVENEAAFFMPETEGPCRFGQYNRLQRIILDRYGFKNLPIISPTSEDSYSFKGQLSSNDVFQLRKLIWQSIAYSDLIEKALWKVRPYEKVKGTTDKIFNQAMKIGTYAIEKGGDLLILKAARKAASMFSAIEQIRTPKPVIGIVGEIFIRTHKESNQNLVKQLESMGCEATVASVSEWVAYTTNTGIEESYKHLIEHKSLTNLLNYFKFLGASKYQEFFMSMLSSPFKSLLSNRLDHKTSQILKSSENVFSNHINGEAILSIGGALSYSQNHYDGIINAMPFTCMPSTVASSILKTEMRGKLPYIDMVYDGSIQPNRETNLATFVFQAKRHFLSRK